MRAIWTGAISFGLVNIPVNLYKATEENRLDFKLLAEKDLSPIHYLKIAASDGREVPFNEIVKGYEIEKGEFILLEEKDFEKAFPRRTKTIEIVNFVQKQEIDPFYFEKPYYLEPGKNAEKQYALLREALSRSAKVAITKVVLRNREHLAAILTYKELLILNLLRFSETIRSPEKLNLPDKKVLAAKEIEMGMQLIDQLSEKFNPAQYKDTYTGKLKKIIEAKAKGEKIEIKEQAPQPTKVADLMAELKKSLDLSKRKQPLDRPPIKKTRSSKKTKTKSTEKV